MKPLSPPVTREAPHAHDEIAVLLRIITKTCTVFRKIGGARSNRIGVSFPKTL